MKLKLDKFVQEKYINTEKMKAKSFIAFILITAAVVFAGVELRNFSVSSSGGNVVLTWQTTTESNLRNFIIERKSVNGSFLEVGVMNPRSDKNYEFTDPSAFKSSNQLYVYRLKIVDNDGSVSYSDEKAVAHNVSSVKRTWGSIKALFR